jgi:hypothetical protein
MEHLTLLGAVLKSLNILLKQVLVESGTLCHTSTAMDLKTIYGRVEDEGVSFLTITLPNFGKDLEKGLDQGFVDRNLFHGFSWKGGLPRFLGGFLDLIFDRSTGRLLERPSIDAIHSLRQITLMFGKVELECADWRTKAAFDKYVSTEQEVRDADKNFHGDRKANFGRIASMLFGNVLSKVDSNVYYGEIVPKHGSGATADKVKGNAKYLQTEWTDRLEEFFPHGEYLFPSWSHFLDSKEPLTFLDPGSERPAKVISVPKTLKTPRLIAMEPVAMQYAQQGLLEAIVKAIREDDISRNLISWDDQKPNQHLAKLGSSSGELATLDLSEASDRVSNQHVRHLLRNHSHFAGAVDACRSRKADVDGHGVLRLAKFASMGSALCFPMEAIVFCTVIFMGIEKCLNRSLTMKDVKSLIGKVRVYGDDIIVPVEYVGPVVSELEAFGFKVNTNKSFWTGKFRESCGKDYYDGHDVSIVRVRSLLPEQRGHVPEIISTVSLRNQLYYAGYWSTVKWLDGIIEGLIPFPYVLPTSPAIGRWSFLGHETERIHPTLHKPLVKAAVVVSKLPQSNLDGSGALLKYFLKRSELPYADREHLVRA